MVRITVSKISTAKERRCADSSLLVLLKESMLAWTKVLASQAAGIIHESELVNAKLVFLALEPSSAAKKVTKFANSLQTLMVKEVTLSIVLIKSVVLWATLIPLSSSEPLLSLTVAPKPSLTTELK